eukprot:scaffold125513_cov21-Tisochrysis_lutea.AAC.2
MTLFCPAAWHVQRLVQKGGGRPGQLLFQGCSLNAAFELVNIPKFACWQESLISIPYLTRPRASNLTPMSETVISHIHSQGEAVDELLELARLRLARGAVGFADEGQVAVFSAVTALLGALRRLDTAP